LQRDKLFATARKKKDFEQTSKDKSETVADAVFFRYLYISFILLDAIDGQRTSVAVHMIQN